MNTKDKMLGKVKNARGELTKGSKIFLRWR